MEHQSKTRRKRLTPTDKFLIIGATVFVVFLVISALWHANSPVTKRFKEAQATHRAAEAKAKADAEAAAQAKSAAEVAQARQAAIDKYAVPYCQSHTSIHMEDLQQLVKEGWPTHVGTQAWTADQCATIIGKLHDQGSTDEKLQGIVDSNVWIGQTYLELLYSWGLPDDYNSTNYGAGVTNQLIYNRAGYHTQYVYIEDGKVSSYQNY